MNQVYKNLALWMVIGLIVIPVRNDIGHDLVQGQVERLADRFRQPLCLSEGGHLLSQSLQF